MTEGTNPPLAAIVAQENPPDPTSIAGIRLFAVIGTWMEEDVIEATVANAFTQGCEKVYLVDNASADETVTRACARGAVLAHSYRTQRYEEATRNELMNRVMRDVSVSQPDEALWWLFLDADEFPHAPAGMTLLSYLRTLDRRFRVVGARFFDHYPSQEPPYVPGFHPLDFQPLCEEIMLPMCEHRHRKHPLVQWQRGGPVLEADRGHHLVRCDVPVLEPMQPVLMHHFPFRERDRTQARLEALWRVDQGASRAEASEDTHMLARHQSIQSVYRGNWSEVVNFVAIDPIVASLDHIPAGKGVQLRPWTEAVAPQDQHVLRWYSMKGAWNYPELPEIRYGDDTSYRKGMEFLDGHGVIEDWGCGLGHARKFVSRSRYVGVDGSGTAAEVVADLGQYRSRVDCIFMRHVLEHNANWRQILVNALDSFQRRMVLVVFTPFGEVTRQVATTLGMTTIPVPDISFRREDITERFAGLEFSEETLDTDTQYGVEYIFYLEQPGAEDHGRATALIP
jgi:hypothetical protein